MRIEGNTLISVVGIDCKLHLAEPHKDTCLCGAKVKRKKLLRDDHELFWCYECDYASPAGWGMR